MVDLTGKTALVTGSSKGIGRGIAKGLAESGATIAINYPIANEEENAMEVVNQIQENGGEAEIFKADVSVEQEVNSMITKIGNILGTIDVLVNNAGIAPQSPFTELSTKTWDRTLEVNLRGVFLVTREVIPGMLERGSGKIINIASQLAFKGGAELVHYSAAKGGIIGFTRALAREVSPKINVNAIAPGSIDTDLTHNLSDEWRAAKEEEIPLGRLGEIKDIVPTAVFLASNASDYYTGQTLSPDGGDAMH